MQNLSEWIRLKMLTEVEKLKSKEFLFYLKALIAVLVTNVL